MQDKEEVKQPEKKKHVYEFVNIKKSEVLKKNQTSTVNRFQKFICWVIRVVPANTYQYMIRIHYSGRVRLKKNDVVINKQGLQFVVVREENRYALILSMPDVVDKPYIYEKLYLLPKPKSKTK